MHVNHSKQGKRNRQRGAELQREIIKMAKKYGLEAWNRDRGGAQHEMGDLEIEGFYFGCKRRKTLARYLLPEKCEEGVFLRPDRGISVIMIPAWFFLTLLMVRKRYEEAHEKKTEKAVHYE